MSTNDKDFAQNNGGYVHQDEQWYYNTSTGEVSLGYDSDWSHRMGPYATKEEAERAIEIANERNLIADAMDEAEKED